MPAERLVTDSPKKTPPQSPAGLALAAAWQRRNDRQAVAANAPSALKTQVSTSQGVDVAPTALSSVVAAQTSSAPVVPAQPIGTPNAVTGVVTSKVDATDPGGGTLTYTVTGAPVESPSTWATARGTVAMNQASGVYVYTPTQAARLAAGSTATADTDGFIVAVSNGLQTTSTPVAVYVSPLQIEGVALIPVGNSPAGATVSADGRMYVANTGSNTVSVIDTATNEPIDTNPNASGITSIPVGSSPSALALSGNRLFVANTGSGTVSVINTDTYQRIDANPSGSSTDIPVGSSPSALALSGNRLYVANRGSNTVSVIDTATYSVIDTNPSASGVNSISVGSSPSALALSGNRLYVANRGSNTVSVIDTVTYKVIDTNPSASGVNSISVGSSPSALALGPDGRLYVTNSGSGTVSVINTANYQRIDANPSGSSMDARVGSAPSSVAISPDGSLAYVANGPDTVSVIDTKTYAVVRTVEIDTLGPETSGHVITLSPDGSRVYTIDAYDRWVSVLALTRANTAPVGAAAPTVGTPNPLTGAVSGALNVQDPDGDPLSFTVNGVPPASGTVLVGADGSYVYAPSQAARDNATQTPTLTFTVRAADALGAFTNVSVTVPVSPTAAQPGIPVAAVSPISVGDSPIGITVAGTRLYVVNSAANTLSVIDTTTNRVVDTIPVTAYPTAVAATADASRVYVAYYDTVSVIDTVTDEVTNVAIPDLCQEYECYGSAGGLVDVMVSPDGRYVWAARQYAFDNGSPSAISVIDPVSKQVTSTGMSYAVVDMEFARDGSTRIYMADAGYHAVLMSDPVTGEFADIWVNNPGWLPVVRSVAISPTGKQVYAVVVGSPWDYSSKELAVIDTDRTHAGTTYNTQVASITLPAAADRVVFSPDCSRAYATHPGGKTVSVIDTATSTVVGMLNSSQIGGDYAALNVGSNGTLYFTNYANDTVYAVTLGPTGLGSVRTLMA